MTVQDLFWEHELSDSLNQSERNARDIARRVTESDLRSKSTPDLVGEIVRKAELAPPSMDLGAAHQLPPEDVRLSIMDFGRQLEVAGTRIVVVIPFEGDRNLFFTCPSSYTSLLPRADVRNREIRLEYQFARGREIDIKSAYEKDLENLKRYLDRVRADVAQFRSQLERAVLSEIEAKKARVEEALSAAAKLELPVRIIAAADAAIAPAPRPGARLNKVRKYDAFICHASEDKDFVAPLALALQEMGFEIWYDDFVLSVGDSLRRKIDEGLAGATFGVVVLSEPFFEKRWPQYELDGLVAKEMDGRKVVLPIWRSVDVSRVRSYSPTLADRVSLSVPPKSLAEVASALGTEFSK